MWITSELLYPRENKKITNKHNLDDMIYYFMNPILFYNIHIDLVLELAAKYGKTAIIKEYLKDPRVDLSSIWYKACKGAIEGNYKKIIDILMYDPHVEYIHAINYIVDNNRTEYLKKIINIPGVSPDNELINIASQYGYLNIIENLLLDPRTNPGNDDNYPIRIAAEKGHTEIIKLLLLDSRVNPLIHENHLIGAAAEMGHIKAVKLLLKVPGINPSTEHNYPVSFAAFNGYPEIVKILLRYIKEFTEPQEKIFKYWIDRYKKNNDFRYLLGINDSFEYIKNYDLIMKYYYGKNKKPNNLPDMLLDIALLIQKHKND